MLVYVALFAVYFAVLRLSPRVGTLFAFIPATGIFLTHATHTRDSLWNQVWMGGCIGGVSGGVFTLLVGFLCGEVTTVIGVILTLCIVTPIATLEATTIVAAVMIVHRILCPLQEER